MKTEKERRDREEALRNWGRKCPWGDMVPGVCSVCWGAPALPLDLRELGGTPAYHTNSQRPEIVMTYKCLTHHFMSYQIL